MDKVPADQFLGLLDCAQEAVGKRIAAVSVTQWLALYRDAFSSTNRGEKATSEPPGALAARQGRCCEAALADGSAFGATSQGICSARVDLHAGGVKV